MSGTARQDELADRLNDRRGTVDLALDVLLRQAVDRGEGGPPPRRSGSARPAGRWRRRHTSCGPTAFQHRWTNEHHELPHDHRSLRRPPACVRAFGLRRRHRRCHRAEPHGLDQPRHRHLADGEHLVAKVSSLRLVLAVQGGPRPAARCSSSMTPGTPTCWPTRCWSTGGSSCIGGRGVGGAVRGGAEASVAAPHRVVRGRPEPGRGDGPVPPGVPGGRGWCPRPRRRSSPTPSTCWTCCRIPRPPVVSLTTTRNAQPSRSTVSGSSRNSARSYDDWVKICVLIDWNLGNFSVDYHGDRFRLLQPLGLRLVRMDPRTLDFYFLSRVSSRTGDRTVFSYGPHLRRAASNSSSTPTTAYTRCAGTKSSSCARSPLLHPELRDRQGFAFFQPELAERLQRGGGHGLPPRLDELDLSRSWRSSTGHRAPRDVVLTQEVVLRRSGCAVARSRAANVNRIRWRSSESPSLISTDRGSLRSMSTALAQGAEALVERRQLLVVRRGTRAARAGLPRTAASGSWRRSAGSRGSPPRSRRSRGRAPCRPG